MTDSTMQRNIDFVVAYQKLIHSDKELRYVKTQRILERVINGGAPSFYIELEPAKIYIIFKKQGKYPPSIRKDSIAKKRCDDLYATYLRLKEQYPDCYFYQLVEKVISSPAPSFYISIRRAARILQKSCKK